MPFNTAVFQEPRGVMRVLQFIFSICAFATTSGFSNFINIQYCQTTKNVQFDYDFPFKLMYLSKDVECVGPANETIKETLSLYGDFSSDARFFVATGVLSFLYCIGILVVYTMYDNSYQSNPLVPMADFILTVLLAVFWISGSAAWSNGISGLKSITEPQRVLQFETCKKIFCSSASGGSFSTLNVSAILGFLNFFLWASDLWFLYKETQWFKNISPVGAGGTDTLA